MVNKHQINHKDLFLPQVHIPVQVIASSIGGTPGGQSSRITEFLYLEGEITLNTVW